MAITDQDMLSETQQHVFEVPNGGLTWNSEQWSAAEVLALFNQRQNRFLRDTLLLVSQANLIVVAGTRQPALPDEWIATIHMAWQDAASGLWYPMSRADSLEYDRGAAGWETDLDIPQGYMDEETPTLTTQIAPVPAADGVLETLYTGLAAVLDGAGEIFTVPDEFVPYIKYGALADMFGKLGRAHDSAKAVYCESRYQEGVALGKLYLEGLG